MMDNGSQGHYSTSTSNSVESRTSNMYILQVKPSSSEGSLQADALPLHMLINGQDPQHHQYFIPVIQGKQLQLFIDSREQAGTNTANNQYYSIVTEPQTVNNELQIANSDISVTPSHEHILQIKTDAKSRINKLSLKEDKINNTKASHNAEQKKRVVQKFVHISDRAAPPRAVAVLPGALRLRRGAVWPRGPLPARVRFGPVQGIKRNLSTEEAESLKLAHSNSGSPLFLLKTEDGTHTHIDVSDQDKSNWLSLLPLGDQSTANVWLYQEDHELYAATINTIPARVPLALGYSKEYVDAHKLPVEQPVLDLEAELTAKHRQWWCHECQRSMSTAALLQQHMDVYHTEEKQRPRRYRCLHCTRSFCRLFTLRRHTARHCTKKAKEDKNNLIQAGQTVNGLLDSSKPDDLPDLPITPADDSRLPSDESLQTLTNNLDFSTTLFDPDRINLDMSGSSREDFNYSLGLKDDIALAAGIDFGIDDSCSKKDVRKENTETVFLTCRYCNQAVIRGRQRQHVKSCTGRKFHCGCGRAFQYKDKLALHIHIDHPNLTSDQRRLKNSKEDELQYKCETCNHKFKRRGMLVNHLWRVHKTVSTAVPLEKKVRHYPCVTCPKVYRTAAKRDSHVKIHHPGLSVPGVGTSIEGGLVSCAPAACSACPRQYATRAKLLQHVRLHHPALAPPVKQKIPFK
ncbi:PR domain zinc finger protein 10-like isoform X1 [Cydia fagiglandana]|uniref:PR domain zinc finger protein 10-like isoform X1 n=1 Tax=Cydia fagiglandana TaxID=1458189 RepID=UPI002FEE061D